MTGRRRQRARASSGELHHSCCVIDLETAADPFARSLARRKRLTQWSPLNEITTATAMRLDFGASGELLDIELRTWHRTGFEERDLLINLLDQIDRATKSGGQLITYNGRRFDVPLLRMRQLRWWLGGHDLLKGMVGRQSAHFDVMAEFAYGLPQPPSLVEACAMVGFALRGPDRLYDENALPPEYEKCETDVLGTAILYLYLQADALGDAAILSRNLTRLGAGLVALGGRSPHLARFAKSPLLAADAKPWGAP